MSYPHPTSPPLAYPDPSTTPNPYENPHPNPSTTPNPYGNPHPDPFVSPHEHYGPDLRGPPQPDYLGHTSYSRSYELHDDPPYDPPVSHHDIPLLRRDDSATSSMSGRVPGGYEPTSNDDPDEANNIRYGRIPQRVPRRYKTIKKVE